MASVAPAALRNSLQQIDRCILGVSLGGGNAAMFQGAKLEASVRWIAARAPLPRAGRWQHGPDQFAGPLHACHSGYAACVGIPNQAALARFPPNIFHTTGLVTYLAGVRYELGLFVPAEIAATMSEIIHAARARDPRIVWQLPAGTAAP